MKVRSSVKPICEKCKIIKRELSVRIRSTNSVRDKHPYYVCAMNQAADSMIHTEVCRTV